MSSSTAGGTLPIDQLITPTTPAVPKADATTQQLGADAFLKLLTTQLRNQNPLQPMDSTQSVTQLAQFSALQSQTELKNSFANFQSTFAVTQSASLIGQTVSVNTADASGNSSTIRGKVGQIEVINGQPQFTLLDPNGHPFVDGNGQTLLFPTQKLVGIGG